MSRPVVNIADLPLDRWERGTLYQNAEVRIGPSVGLRNLGISYSEVAPGKSGCPFHNHHAQDEMFIVVQGEGTYRFGGASYPVRAGSVLGAPAGGQDTAHQIINTGSAPLRYYRVSNMPIADVVEYPDSGKFGAYSRDSGNPCDSPTIVHLDRAGASLDYWDGEPGAHHQEEAK